MGYRCNNNVAGVSNRKDCNNVGGVSEANFKVPVCAYIDSENFCSAVNRCLAAAEENKNDCHCGWKRGRY